MTDSADFDACFKDQYSNQDTFYTVCMCVSHYCVHT